MNRVHNTLQPLTLNALNVGPIFCMRPMGGMPRCQLMSHLLIVDGPVGPPDSFIAIVVNGLSHEVGTLVLEMEEEIQPLTSPGALLTKISEVIYHNNI